MKYLTHTGLEPLALALIFIPDPITTVVGIGLLSHIMHIKQRGNLEYHRSMHFRNNHYSYKIDMIDNTTITFQLSATRQGQLPVDWLKIDGIFIRNIVLDREDYAVVKSINEIGQFLGKQTIAEYVADQNILTRIRDIGVDFAQGYAISPPILMDDLISNRCQTSPGTILTNATSQFCS